MACSINALKGIDKNIPVPLYYQLRNQILENIKNGTYPKGEMIPPENELTAYLGISRPTVRQALSDLVNAGYLERRHGLGTFVCAPKIEARFLRRLKTFNEEMKEKGLEPSTTLVSLEKVPAIMDINMALSLAPGAELIELKRTRSAGGEIILYQETYLPYERYSQLMEHDFNTETLYEVLESVYGVRVFKAEREIEATVASARKAKLLNIKVGEAIARVSTVAYTESDEPVEYSISFYRGNRVKFSVDLYR